MRTILSAIGLMIQDFINACLTCSFVGIIILLVVLLTGCGGGGGGGSESAPINPNKREPSWDHLRYYGDHHTNTWFPSVIDEVKSHSNIAYVTKENVQSALDAGLIPLVYIDPRSMFLAKGDWKQQKRDFRPEKWQQYINMLKPFEGKFEVYVMDEPIGRGMSEEDFEWITDMWHEAFPTTTMWVCIGAGVKISQVPYNIDIVTMSPWYGHWGGSQYRHWMNKLYKSMFDHQEFVVTTPAWRDKNHDEYRSDEWIADTTAEVLDIMLYDERVIGALHFLPFSHDGNTGYLDMPLVEKEIVDFYNRAIEEINK